jgi:myo-inositol 2-dehydrogenase / D-chiro-inositol 1-dehydrogenase
MKRRHFLNSAATVAAFQIVPRHVLGGPGFTPPSEMLTRAQIGCGASGNATIARADSPVIAVCDVDRAQLTQGVRRCSAVHRTKPKAYPDFRELLTQPDIDIVTISTPPHWHALMTIAAANSGKDIFCEAPMSRTIAEGQAMVRAVQDSGRVFAVNTLFRFDDSAPFYGTGVHVRDLRKAVAGGLLGWPVRAHLAPAPAAVTAALPTTRLTKARTAPPPDRHLLVWG